MGKRAWLSLLVAAVVWAVGVGWSAAAEAPPAAKAANAADAPEGPGFSAGDARARSALGLPSVRNEQTEPPPIIRRDLALAKEWAKDIAQLRKDANAGSATAEFALGLRQLLGAGIPKDQSEGLDWLLRAAVMEGYAPAQFAVGGFFAMGVPKNDVEAVKWYKRAAQNGLAEGQFALGQCYAQGEGVPKDYVEAVSWYTKAANQGYAEAELSLGVSYQLGEGVAKDSAEAVNWFRRAAEQGMPEAQFNLALCYAHGEGVPEDDAEAVRWYRLAAEQGVADAQFNLAVCYRNGQGVLRSESAALEWYSKAGESYLKDGKREDALTCYDRMKALEPDHFLTKALRAKLYPEQLTGKGG